jgi:arginine utilization regulatory protein
VGPEHLNIATASATSRRRKLPTASPADLVRSLPDRKLGTLEQAAIEVVLEETGGNVAATARELGIHRQTLYNKMKALGIR